MKNIKQLSLDINASLNILQRRLKPFGEELLFIEINKKFFKLGLD